jgi:hypothetical protein
LLDILVSVFGLTPNAAHVGNHVAVHELLLTETDDIIVENCSVADCMHCLYRGYCRMRPARAASYLILDHSDFTLSDPVFFNALAQLSEPFVVTDIIAFNSCLFPVSYPSDNTRAVWSLTS